MKAAIEEFLRATSVGRSQASQKLYESVLGRFAAWADEQALTLNELTPGDIGAFLSSSGRNGAPVAKSSARTYLSVLSSFCEYLVDERIITENPARRAAKRLKLKGSQPGPVITRDDAARLPELYEQAWRRHGQHWDIERGRDMAILGLLMTTAIRRIEVARLCVADVLWDDGLLRIHGKGGKVRVAPIIEGWREDLRAYVEQVRPAFPSPDDADARNALFLEIEGDRSIRIRPETITYRVGRVLGLLPGLRGRGKGPHTIRRSVATWLLSDSGGHLRLVQEVLGHANVATTQRYAQLAEAEAIREARSLLEGISRDTRPRG